LLQYKQEYKAEEERGANEAEQENTEAGDDAKQEKTRKVTKS
jgi:hypothetical protein